ncbi:protein piccolo isoform X1, partial [Tachysurus ichikawai]
NVEFEFDTVMIPDSGTAKVRSRPTVKHFSTFGDGAGFAVPTPTVPVLPSFTAPQISHTGKTDSLSNGSIISVDDFEEGQILIPPPPSNAPPPPPPQFIPPSPGHVAPPSAFFGEPHSPVDLSTLEPPSIPPPEPPSLGTPDVDLSMLRPPHMAPPKPPNYQISTDLPEDIPECPKFTPPLPPTEKSQSPTAKVQKMPPPKPIRFSYISNFELPASGSTTPSERPASSFNSQNSGRLYTVPKTTILTGQSDQTHYMLLENNSKTSVGDHANGKASTSEKEMGAPQNLVPPVKPVRRNSSATKLEENLQDLKENMQQAATPVRLENSMAAKVETPPDAPNKNPAPVVGSPTALRSAALLSAEDIIHLTPVDPARKYSPLLNRKLQNLKTNEPSGGKEVATSPLALLMAAKEREKQRTVISRENSSKSNSSVESSNGSSHHNDTRPNSFTVTPRLPVSPGSPSRFLESKHKTENLNVTNFRPEPSAHSIILTKNPTSIASPSGQYNGIDSISFIPPPPEFANSDPEDEAPPSMPPPDPPAKRADVIPQLNSATITSGPTNPPTPPPSQLKTQPQAPPPSQLKTQPQAPPPSQLKTQPQAPPPSQLKTQPQAPPPAQLKTQPQAPPPAQLKTQPQAPPSVTASQATLLSILQKKMLEMDPKFAHAHEADAGSDDWNSPTFDEDAVGVPSVNSTPKTKSSTVSSSVNMKELENKVIRKTQAKAPVSSGSSKQQFGMTFIVRPGTKQPITPIHKTE